MVSATKKLGPERSCGSCNVCCTAMRVAPLDKPAGQRCAHQTDTGCGNYEHRPGPCRDWYCLWVRDRSAIFGDEHRPDRLGVFFTASLPDSLGNQTLFAHEIAPGAAMRPLPRAAIQFLENFASVKVIPARTPDATPATLTLRGTPVN